MPHQQFDENMDRVACQRRCEEDDQDTRVLADVCITDAGESVCARSLDVDKTGSSG